MKLGIDSFGCDHARSGRGTYLLSFVANIPLKSDIEVELFGSPIDKFTYTSAKEIKFIPVNVSSSLNAERFWHFTSSAKFISKRKYDVVLYPALEKVFPINFRTPSIAVINTILSRQIEGQSDLTQKMQVKRGLFRVQKIIAASNFIANDLIEHGVDKEKIEVVYNGIDHKLFYPPISLSDDVVDVKPFAIRKPYFVYGSSLSSSDKKHVELIRAFSLFKKNTGLPHRLVIAGSDGEYSAEVHKAAFESHYASDIFLTGFFPHESFSQVYSGSEGLIFPSIEEGVGLPILEAMATGVPVACSSSCVLPEIAGEAAIYFDSDNIEEMADCMQRLVTDSVLKQDLIKKGLERAGQFNWETTVQKTFDIARKLAM